jgi:hypothetical protein
MRLLAGDSVAAVARIASADLKKAGASANGEETADQEQPSLI